MAYETPYTIPRGMWLHHTELKEREYEAKMDKEHADGFVRKTSHEWYMGLPAQRLADPDGWRNLDVSKQAEFWHTVPISWKEFQDRYAQCSICCDPAKIIQFGSNGKLYPYGQSVGVEVKCIEPKVADGSKRKADDDEELKTVGKKLKPASTRDYENFIYTVASEIFNACVDDIRSKNKLVLQRASLVKAATVIHNTKPDEEMPKPELLAKEILAELEFHKSVLE